MEIGLLPEDSPARTSALPEKVQELPDRGLVFGLNIGDLLGIYDPDSQSWKTWEHSLFGGLMPFSDRFPKSGIMQNGKIYHQAKWAHGIRGNVYGLLFTPTRCDYKGVHHNTKFTMRARQYKDLAGDLELKTIYPHPVFAEVLMGYPEKWTDLKDSEMQLSLK